MSKNQRSLYFILHAVQSMATGMLSTGGLQKKSRDSLQRILNRVEREMESLGPINENDARHLRRAGEALRESWAVNGEEQLSRPAFVTIAMALMADHRAELPPRAKKARRTCADLEGMLFTLYQHFDPGLTDRTAMDIGADIAAEYRQTIANAA